VGGTNKKKFWAPLSEDRAGKRPFVHLDDAAEEEREEDAEVADGLICVT